MRSRSCTATISVKCTMVFCYILWLRNAGFGCRTRNDVVLFVVLRGLVCPFVVRLCVESWVQEWFDQSQMLKSTVHSIRALTGGNEDVDDDRDDRDDDDREQLERVTNSIKFHLRSAAMAAIVSLKNGNKGMKRIWKKQINMGLGVHMNQSHTIIT